MKVYPEYKTSSIDWLGEIPSHWNLSKYKYHATSRMGETILREQMQDTGIPIYSATQDDSILGYIGKANLILKKGDFVIPARGNSIGYVSVVSHNVATCTQTTICSSNFTNINQNFLYYCCIAFKDIWFEFDDTAIPQVTVRQINNNILPVPAVAEQEAIVGYLDEVCGQIDALEAEKQAQVDELRAYRTSLITETVTCGLNPDATLRPSGIDWLGDIPQHWTTSKLGRLANVQTGATPSTIIEKYWANPSENWYTPGDFDGFVLSDSKRKISTTAYIEQACRVFPEFTVLLVGIGATLGKVAYSPCKCSANQQINAIIFKDIVNPIFGAYYLYSIQDTIRAFANAATLPILNQEQTKRIIMVIPPLSEQKEIAEYLDEKTAKIDEAIDELETQLKDLAEYKQAVITEAVTGKVDVRDWKPKN